MAKDSGRHPGMGRNHADYEGNLVSGVAYTRTKISSDAYSQSIGAGDVGSYPESPDDASIDVLDTPCPPCRGGDKSIKG